MPGDRASRFCGFCFRQGHIDTECHYLTLCHGLYELSLMVSHRPGSRVGLGDTQRALDRLVSRRRRNRRQRIRRRERLRAQTTNVARRVNHTANIGRHGPVSAAVPLNRVPSTTIRQPVLSASSLPSRPMNDQSIPAQMTTVPQAVISQRSPIIPQSESVPSVVTVTSDTDVTMGVEELDNGGSEVNASQSQPVDDLIVFDTLDTAEDEIVVISGHNSDIVESHCGEIFTIV